MNLLCIFRLSASFSLSFWPTPECGDLFPDWWARCECGEKGKKAVSCLISHLSCLPNGGGGDGLPSQWVE